MDTISWRVRVRPDFRSPSFAQGGYAVDHYDERGGWTATGFFPTKDAAQRDARRVRRLHRQKAKARESADEAMRDGPDQKLPGS